MQNNTNRFNPLAVVVTEPRTNTGTIIDVLPEMDAIVARKMPEPAGGFATPAQREAFEEARTVRTIALAAEIQHFLDQCADADERQITINHIIEQTALLGTRN